MADETYSERTGGSFSVDAQGKLKRREPEMKVPEIPQPAEAAAQSDVAPAPVPADPAKTKPKGE